MQKFGLWQTLIIILLAILLGSSSLVALGSYDRPLDPSVLRFRYVLVGTSLLLLLLMSGFKLWNFPNKAVPFLTIWTLFGCVLVISGLANSDSVSIRDGFWFVIGVALVFFNALPKLMQNFANLTIALALFLGHIPYIVTSLFLHPIESAGYRGVFANPNQMGMASVTMAAGVFILLMSTPARKTVLYISLASLLLLSTIMIFISSSRTSLLALLAMLFISMSCSFTTINPKGLIKIIGIMTVIGMAIWAFAAKPIASLWDNVVVGLSTKMESESLSGREFIWKETLDNMSLFGHGSDYFDLKFGLGAHNTIIDIIGKNGIVAAFLLVCLAIASFLYAYFYFKDYTKKDRYAIAPLTITTCFWILSIGEGMFGSLGVAITLAYMLSMGVVITKPSPDKL